jgi:hypothetical protein
MQFTLINDALHFKLYGFPIFRFWAYLMKVIPETRRVYYIRYLFMYSRISAYAWEKCRHVLLEMGEYVRIEWATMLKKYEGAYATGMGGY